MHFVTGLINAQFLLLFQSLGEAVRNLVHWKRDQKNVEDTPTKRRAPRHSLAPEHVLLLTLIHIRLGLLQRHVAYIFNISQTTVVNTVITWAWLLIQFKHLDHKRLTTALQVETSLPPCDQDQFCSVFAVALIWIVQNYLQLLLCLVVLIMALTFLWYRRHWPHQTSTCSESTGLSCDKVTSIY